jgi:hypothetical protein
LILNNPKNYCQILAPIPTIALVGDSRRRGVHGFRLGGGNARPTLFRSHWP